MKKQTNYTSKRRKKNIAIAMLLLVVALLVLGVIYRSMRADSSNAAQDRASKDTAKQAASTNSGSSGSSASPTDTPQGQTTPSVAQSGNLPKPVLSKSSGNNGSIPPGVLVNFTCVSSADYFCEVKLQKPGSNSINLDKQQLVGERGVYSTNWYWTSVSGSWSVVATLVGANGQTNSSEIQSLEVR